MTLSRDHTHDGQGRLTAADSADATCVHEGSQTTPHAEPVSHTRRHKRAAKAALGNQAGAVGGTRWRLLECRQCTPKLYDTKVVGEAGLLKETADDIMDYKANSYTRDPTDSR